MANYVSNFNVLGENILVRDPDVPELSQQVETNTDNISNLSQNVIGEMKVNFIAGSQINPVGDCIVIITENNKVGIVDFGNQTDCSSLKSFLHSKNITKIDFVIFSHYHSDHVGGENCAGFLSITNDSSFNFNGATFYLPHNLLVWSQMVGDFSTTINYENIIKTQINSLSGVIVYPIENQVVTIDNLTIKFNNLLASYFQQYYGIHTDYRDVDIGATNYNNFSMCCTLIYKNKRMFLTGDISYNAMMNMSNVNDIDVIKYPHHNIERLYPLNFVCNSSPKYGIICGSTYYSKNQLTSFMSSYYESCGCINYFTTDSGTISITVKYNDISVNAINSFNSPPLTPTLGEAYMISLISPQYSSFDDITTPGEYLFQNNTVVTKLTNYPTLGSGIKLIVEKVTPSNSIRQTAISSTNALECYATRALPSGGDWGDWCYFTGTKQNNIHANQTYYGIYNLPTTPANTYQDVTINFPTTMLSKPAVVCELIHSYTNIPNVANIATSITNISTTGFTVRIFNNSGSRITPDLSWIAVSE